MNQILMAEQIANATATDQGGEQGDIISRGMRFPFDPDILSPRTRASLKGDKYEAREADAALKLVRADDVVMELGAGIGFISTLVAPRVRAVHAFEANPGLLPYIRRVHAANAVTNVQLHHALIGRQKGQATFYVRRNFLASSMDRMDGDGIVTEAKVEVRNGRKVMKQIAPTILICDIEGAEAEVIPALDLAGLRAAVIELHPQWIGAKGVRRVFDAMQAAGLIYYPRRSNAKVVCFRKDW